MTFLPMVDSDELGTDQRTDLSSERPQTAAPFGNFGATIRSHPLSLSASLQLSSLWDALVPCLGERAVSFFAYAISDENRCLLWVAHLRRILISTGEDADHPDVTETEQLLIDWGRRIARDSVEISAEFYDRLELAFQPQLRLLLVSFAGQMIATNVVSSAGRVPLDSELSEYRKPGDLRIS